MSDFRFDTSHIDWSHIQGGPDDGYPIDYSMAVLGYQEDNGTLDLLVRFAPNSHCHFHKHIAATTTLVLEGEHHITEVTDSGEQIQKVRAMHIPGRTIVGRRHMRDLPARPGGAGFLSGLASLRRSRPSG